MKKTFLDSLVNLNVNDAESKVLAEGYKAIVYNENSFVTSVARPDTVILWQKDGRVTSAEAGDPFEVE